QLTEAVQLLPDCAQAHDNLGVVLEHQGKWQAALRSYQEAVRLQSDLVDARCNLAGVLYELGRTDEADVQFGAATRLDPHWQQAAAQVAWPLATHPDPKQRNASEALRIARQVCRSSGNHRSEYLDMLAACHAAVGSFAEAEAIAQQALEASMPS